LRSETPETRSAVDRRLERLRDDPACRASWLGLVRAAWEALSSGWRDEGQSIVESARRALSGRVATVRGVADLQQLLENAPNGCIHDLLPGLMAEARQRGDQIVVVPAWLGRKGFILSLEGLLTVGPSSRRSAAPSAATHAAARRLRALGDPTRLAMLECLAVRPSTVGELARQFGLAQPTISNHVRILRDAGLLAGGEKADGRRLRADTDAVARFLGEVQSAFTVLQD
jgi:DNA-binding transcriptional ArsR family regulator